MYYIYKNMVLLIFEYLKFRDFFVTLLYKGDFRLVGFSLLCVLCCQLVYIYRLLFKKYRLFIFPLIHNFNIHLFPNFVYA